MTSLLLVAGIAMVASTPPEEPIVDLDDHAIAPEPRRDCQDCVRSIYPESQPSKAPAIAMISVGGAGVAASLILLLVGSVAQSVSCASLFSEPTTTCVTPILSKTP